jgi:hypothetical protein
MLVHAQSNSARARRCAGSIYKAGVAHSILNSIFAPLLGENHALHQ